MRGALCSVDADEHALDVLDGQLIESARSDYGRMNRIQGAALLVSLVALQTTWGVAYDVAVRNAATAIETYVRRHGQKPVELEDVKALMRTVAPPFES